MNLNDGSSVQIFFVRLLLRRGADPSLGDWPCPVLVLAIRAGDTNMVEWLLKRGVQVNRRLKSADQSQSTPLHVACESLAPDATDIVRLLLDHGAQASVGLPSMIDAKERVNRIPSTVSQFWLSPSCRIRAASVTPLRCISVLVESRQKRAHRSFISVSNKARM